MTGLVTNQLLIQFVLISVSIKTGSSVLKESLLIMFDGQKTSDALNGLMLLINQ